MPAEGASVVLPGLVEVPQQEASLLLEAGHLLLEMGRAKEAEEIFVGVAALLPESDVPQVALGNLYFAQGNYAKALKAHQEALKRRPESALALAHVGETLLWLKRDDEAVVSLRKAQELDKSGPAGAFAGAVLEAHQAGALRAS